MELLMVVFAASESAHNATITRQLPVSDPSDTFTVSRRNRSLFSFSCSFAYRLTFSHEAA